MTTIITAQEARRLFGRGLAYDAQDFAESLTAALVKRDFKTPRRVRHFLAQAAHESGGFSSARENMRYSTKNIMKIFGVGKHSAAVTLEEARILAGKAEALAERVYGLGNPRKARELGNTSPGDGFKYRGGGPIQLTGKDAYADMEKLLNVGFVRDPDLIARPEYALDVAALWFSRRKGLFAACDANDVVRVTRAVNGGTNHLKERRDWLAKIERVLPDSVLEPRLAAVAGRPPAVITTGSVSQPSERYSPDQIEAIQARLTELRYFPGKHDGVYGKRTRAAILAFQDDIGLPITGEIDDETIKALAVAVPRADRDVTVEDLKESGSAMVGLGSAAKKIGGTIAGAAGVGGVSEIVDLDGVKDTITQVTGVGDSVKDAASTVVGLWKSFDGLLQSYWWIIVLAMAVAMIWIGSDVIKRRLEEARSGANMGK